MGNRKGENGFDRGDDARRPAADPAGCHEKPERSFSLQANACADPPNACTGPHWLAVEGARPNDAEQEAIRYIDELLQVEDIGVVESVQRGINTPAFSQGGIVHDPNGSGRSEHAVHHFHDLVLDAYKGAEA